MRLIFVYNADAGFFNTVTGFAHKKLSPKTYPCTLCKITHPDLAMNEEWRGYLKSLPMETVFVHRDEYRNFPGRMDAPLPHILLERKGNSALLAEADEIAAQADVAGLIALLNAKLAEVQA